MRVTKKKKNRPLLAIIAFVGGVAVVLVTISFGQELRRRVELQQHVTDLKKQINEHDTRIADLRKLIEYLKTDDYIEKAAHEKLGFQVVGEHAVIVPGGAKVAGAETSAQDNADKNVSIPKQWWNLFFSPPNE
jgi:cell division protein FtsB